MLTYWNVRLFLGGRLYSLFVLSHRAALNSTRNVVRHDFTDMDCIWVKE